MTLDHIALIAKLLESFVLIIVAGGYLLGRAWYWWRVIRPVHNWQREMYHALHFPDDYDVGPPNADIHPYNSPAYNDYERRWSTYLRTGKKQQPKAPWVKK